jgi:hypothetical protein
MGLFNNDSSKTALSMGRVILILNDIESKVNNGADIYDFKDDIEFMAFICRVNILDRIEKNNWSQHSIVTIPTGIVSTIKVSLSEGLMLTVGKIKEMVENDIYLQNSVEELLTKRGYFYYWDKNITLEQRNKL